MSSRTTPMRSGRAELRQALAVGGLPDGSIAKSRSQLAVTYTIVALNRTPRFRRRAAGVETRCAGVPGTIKIDVTSDGTAAAARCQVQDVPVLLASPVDVIYASGHTWYGDQPEGFLNTPLAELSPITTSVLIADGCWTAAAAFRTGLACARPASLPALAVLVCDGVAPYSHDPLFAPLMERLLMGGRSSSWFDCLEKALHSAVNSDELRSTRLQLGRWSATQIAGRLGS